MLGFLLGAAVLLGAFDDAPDIDDNYNDEDIPDLYLMETILDKIHNL